MTFCHACGQRLVVGGRYCQHCGAAQELTQQAAPEAAVTQPIPVSSQREARPTTGAPEAAEERPPVGDSAPAVVEAAAEAAGPALPSGHAVRIGVAAVLLVLSLLTGWDAAGAGADTPWTLLALLTALFACAVPYLSRSVLPDRRLPPGQLDAVVALLIAPVVLVAVVTMIRGLAVLSTQVGYAVGW